MPRGRFDAEAGVGHAAGDVGGDGGMGEFAGVVTLDGAVVDSMFREHEIEQQTRAGIALTIHETDAASREVAHVPDSFWIAACDHQSLSPCGEIDEPVRIGSQHLRITAQELWRELADRNMQAGQVAASCISEETTSMLLRYFTSAAISLRVRKRCNVSTAKP